jgi:hypothetical protein
MRWRVVPCTERMTQRVDAGSAHKTDDVAGSVHETDDAAGRGGFRARNG